ncbi:MAG TPA: methyltransferase regulatory domain-containing protein [Thermomonas sp.]|nr:methyltransferase regulatory domain-containing protein [Thermomonas sp.]
MNDAFAYDVVEYPSYIHPQMHPSRLAALARLHGIAAASPRQCHLLEVGCGDGLQLLTLAQAYPESQFVGVDLSASAIARGEAMRASLGLENLQLVAADLREWNPGPRPYDYVLAHGFYSWVPGFVRERLLALCGQSLAAAGVAYISFNALPGCHIRKMLAQMMKFEVGGIPDPGQRLAAASGFLQYLRDGTPGDGRYAELLRGEATELLGRTEPSVVFHDDLADVNDAFLITDFVAQAAPHGLAFLAEADYSEMSIHGASESARSRLQELEGVDPLLKEQHLDFLKGRRFRQTLLRRAEAAFQPAPLREAVLAMEAVGQIRAEVADGGEADMQAGVSVRFAGPEGAALRVDHPAAKAALVAMGSSFPLPLHATELLALARQACASQAPIEDDAEALMQVLVAGFQMGLLILHVDAPRFSARADECPLSSALARLQIEAGQDVVASLRPSMVRLDNRLALELARLLDGKRNRDTILHDLALRMSKLPVPGDDGEQGVKSEAWWRQVLAPQLAEGLQQMARMGLLVETEVARGPSDQRTT